VVINQVEAGDFYWGNIFVACRKNMAAVRRFLVAVDLVQKLGMQLELGV
jgi:hypothetical protein